MRYLPTVLLGLLFQGFGCSALMTSDQAKSQSNLAHKPIHTTVQPKNEKRRVSQYDYGVSVKGIRAVPSMPSQTEICNSDEMLLSIYEFRELYGTPLPKACCHDVIKLQAQWRCEHDWPSSDVPTCTSLSSLADRLMRFIDARPKWYTTEHRRRATANVGRLRSLSLSKGDCIP